MKILIVSSSLNGESKSRLLALELEKRWAGGSLSYMSVMNLANSLMLGFRMFILPRFVYVTSEDWEGEQLGDGIGERIDQFATSFANFANRLTA